MRTSHLATARLVSSKATSTTMPTPAFTVSPQTFAQNSEAKQIGMKNAT